MALRISDLGTAPTVEETDLVEIAEVDGESPSGYSSYKTTILGIANKIATSTVFSGLVTTAKNIVGAINEIVNGFDDNVIDVIKDLKQVRSATITDGIATFDDVLEANPLVEATATFSPIQSGTGDPSPTNIRPISGWDGLNLRNGGKNRVVDVIERAFVTTSGVISTANDYNMYLAPVEQGKKYTVTSDNTTTTYAFYSNKPTMGSISYNNSRTVVSSAPYTFTAPITGWCAFRCDKNFSNWQLEEGETATERQAPIDYPATFDNTIYGGSYDFVSGDGSETWADKVLLSSLTWQKYTSSSAYGTLYYTDSIASLVTSTSDQTKIYTCCDIFNSVDNYTHQGQIGGLNEQPDNSMRINPQKRLYVRCESVQTIEDFETLISTHDMSYKKATPTPIELTGQEIEALEGVNVVTTDGDGMTAVKYKKMNL